jgi:hypothetical protein
MTGLEAGVLGTILQGAAAAGTLYAATRKPKGGKVGPKGPTDSDLAESAAAAADRRRRAALAARGHAGNVLTGPSGVAPSASKVLGG